MKLNEITSQSFTAEELIKIARKVGSELYDRHEAGRSGLVFHDDFKVMSSEEYYNSTDDGHIDTFDYVFFPSSKTGIDAADDKKVTDKSIRDKDGLLYIGGADGVKVVYFGETPPNIAPLKKPDQKISGDTDAIINAQTVKEFKKAVLAVWPDARFDDRTFGSYSYVTVLLLDKDQRAKVTACSFHYDKSTGKRSTQHGGFKIELPDLSLLD